MLKIKDGAQYKAFTSPSEAEDFVRAALDSHLGSVAGVDGPPPPALCRGPHENCCCKICLVFGSFFTGCGSVWRLCLHELVLSCLLRHSSAGQLFVLLSLDILGFKQGF